MAAVTTIAAGGWSTGSTVFSGGSGVGGVPTNADTVTITHAITLDTTAAVADSVVINASGSLIAQTAGDSKLIVDKTISTATNSTAVVTLDVSSVPQYKCEIYCNADTGSNANGITLSGDFDLKGAPKTALTYVSGSLAIGATSCTVDDATGWRQGDKIVFCTTQAYNSTPRVDVVTLNGSYSDGSTSLTWTGGLTYAHDDNCIAGNFTRNLIIGPSSGSNADSCSLTLDTSSRATAAIVRDVEFRNCRQSSAGSGGVLRAQSSAAAQTLAEISNCAFYEWQGTAVLWTNAAMGTATGGVTRTNNIFYSATASTVAISTGALSGPSIGDEYGLMIFRAATGISTLPHGASFVDAKLSGCTTSAVSAAGTFPDYAFTTSGSYGGSGIWSCNAAIALAQTNSAPIRLDSVRLGLGPHATNANYSSANNANLIAPGSGLYDVEFYNCDENISGGALMNAAPSLQTQRFKFLNRDLSLDVQEIYQNTSSTVPSHNKSVVAAELTRSTSSLVMTFTTSAAVTAPIRDYVVSVPAKADTAIRILIYVAKSATNSPVSGDVAYGASTLPYATLSGLGITPVTVTLDTDSVAGYSSGVFELMAIDLPAASAPDADGELTLTLTGQSATSGAQCYWAGIPVAPFITRCRHYGYLFDETSLTRTRNYTVTVTASDTDLPTPTELVSSEATASGIGGITVSWAAGGSSITATAADKTFQELYDYTQAQACLNVASALPITGAGVAGSPALFAQGNVTISTTKKLSGAGSLSMGAYTLTSDSPWAFTYTGGTFARASTTADVSFSGGTLNIGAAGTYTYTQAAAMILSMTPTAPGTYALGDSAFTGQVDLRNTAAHAITVELPTGTSYTTANNSGGTITVTVPIVTADISITGMPNATGANNRLQIINLTAVSAASRANSTAYSVGAIRLRQTGIGSENTAGLYLRCTTAGTSAGSPPAWNTTVGGTTTDGTAVWTTYAVLYYDADPAGTSLTDTYIDGEEFLAGETVEIRFAEEDPAVSFKTYSTSVVATADGFSALVNESSDDVYASYALSGATYDTTFSPNYTSNYIVLDTNTNFSGASAFAYYCYLLTTSDGMYRFWGGLTALDTGNIRNNTATISLYFDESAGFVRQTDDVRIFRDDGARPAIDPTTGGAGIEINWRTPVNVVSTGGSALTTEEHNALLALPSASTVASTVLTSAQSTPIYADARKMNGATITGTGVDSDLWRGA